MAVRVVRESCGSMGLGRQGEASALMNAPLCFSLEHKCSVFYGAPRKSKLLSTLCSADVCQCAEGETLGRGSGVGRRRGWGLHGFTWALTSGKCPRQRRALERGQQDLEGYRMKFACYSPRVDYGQSSRPGPGPGPGPGPDPPSRSLRFGLLLSGPWAALSLCTDLPSS